MKASFKPLLSTLRRPGLRGLLLGLLCGLAAWLSTRPAIMRGVDDWMMDGCFSYRGSRPTHARVILIGLDTVSLDTLHKPVMELSPELAEVVAFARKQKAAAIGMDLMIPESLSNRPDLDIDQPGDASRLGQAIADAGNVVLPEREVNGHWLRPVVQWQFKALTDPSPKHTDFGFVDLSEDKDYFLRRQRLYDQADDRPAMHFALALHAIATGAEVQWREGGLWVAGERLPLDAEQELPINFTGPPGSFPVISFGDALAAARSSQVPQGMPDLAGAIVIIGVTAEDQKDLYQTPYADNFFRNFASRGAGLTPGPEIHAHIIATLVDRAFIITPAWLQPLPLLLVAGALLGMAFTRLNLEWGAVLAVVHHFVWRALCVALFAWFHWRLEMAGMLLLGFLAYGVTFGLRWRRLRRMFGVVKSEAIAQALETDPRHLDLGGEERVVTVLFADIRSFTDFSEAHTPHEVVALLNAYFAAVVPLIDAHGGTLNTYIGDGIMVLYGAPVACSDHARQAVRTAVAMVRRVHELHDLWTRLGSPAFRIGVGVHTGKVVIGAVGSPRRLDYTAIGDTVNTAARIEAENKRLHTEILVSADAYQALGEAERKALGCIDQPESAEVKGKKQVLYLHTVSVP